MCRRNSPDTRRIVVKRRHRKPKPGATCEHGVAKVVLLGQDQSRQGQNKPRERRARASAIAHHFQHSADRIRGADLIVENRCAWRRRRDLGQQVHHAPRDPQRVLTHIRRFLREERHNGTGAPKRAVVADLAVSELGVWVRPDQPCGLLGRKETGHANEGGNGRARRPTGRRFHGNRMQLRNCDLCLEGCQVVVGSRRESDRLIAIESIHLSPPGARPDLL